MTEPVPRTFESQVNPFRVCSQKNGSRLEIVLEIQELRSPVVVVVVAVVYGFQCLRKIKASWSFENNGKDSAAVGGGGGASLSFRCNASSVFFLSLFSLSKCSFK